MPRSQKRFDSVRNCPPPGIKPRPIAHKSDSLVRDCMSHCMSLKATEWVLGDATGNHSNYSYSLDGVCTKCFTNQSESALRHCFP